MLLKNYTRPLMTEGLERHRSIKGFTLLEVVLAVGIFSFAAVSILGVMPTFLDSMRASSGKNVSSRLLGEVAVEASQLESRSMSSFVSSFPRYFDVRGLPVDGNSAVYRLDVFIRSSTGSLGSHPESPPIHSEPLLISENDARIFRFQITGLTGIAGSSVSLIQALEPE